MTNIIDYLMMVVVSITIFNMFSQNEKGINLFFLILVGVYYLFKSIYDRKGKKGEQE